MCITNRNFTRIRNENGEILEGIDACTYMSNYYAHNGVRLASKFTTSWNINDFSPVNKPKKQFHFCFIPMDIVSKLVKEIEISKSSGIPNLSSQLLKDAFSILIPELTHLFNESINTGIFPSTWATGYITPIPKEGDPMDPGNWRPITILPLPSKLLKKAIHAQITIFLDNNNVLDCRQHGFRFNYSTSTAIFQLVKELYSSYDEGNCTSCIFVDYRKAFETLDHSILCQKLEGYNFSPLSVSWFQSYLENRKHIVRTNNIASDPAAVRYGVPQGSTLGPLLFILYVNDLLGSLTMDEDENIIMYADDTVLYTNHNDPLTCMSRSQNLFDQLYNWCLTNKLTININKTKHMFIVRKKSQEETVSVSNICVKNEFLPNVKSYKYLGVDIDLLCPLTLW